jgi:hypothetical protein
VRRRMMRRTTDEKAWLAGQSKANQSKQHRGKAAQWGRHKERVDTRLAGHREGGREFKNKRTSFLLLAGDRCCCFKEATSRACSQGGLQHENMRMNQTILEHIFVN